MVNPKFIFSDLSDKKYDGNNLENYDFINLSNLGTWLSLPTTKRILDTLVSHLNDDGKLLICYLYDTIETTSYSVREKAIYNVSKSKEFFPLFIVICLVF